MADLQAVLALSIVAAVASWLGLGFVRSLKRPGCAGCACARAARRP